MVDGFAGLRRDAGEDSVRVHRAGVWVPLAALVLSAAMAAGCMQHQTRQQTQQDGGRAAQVGAPSTMMGQARTLPQSPLSIAPRFVAGDRYERVDVATLQRFRDPRSAPRSTFSVDVDTGSYANVRRLLREGTLPPAGAVRLEEMVNYFRYGEESREALWSGRDGIAVTTELAAAPIREDLALLKITLHAPKLKRARRPAANLVFLLDVSGSMKGADRLPLLQRALTYLARQLNEQDRVALVAYAGGSGVVLAPTSGADQRRIRRAIERLGAGGSTHGSAGLATAYALAREGYIAGGVNRVLLCTDGDFNVGVVDGSALESLVVGGRKDGIALTTLGVGRGNYHEAMMERLADVGDGNHAYLDSMREARKVLGRQLEGTLVTVAHDVKVQVEFNPANVAAYRLLGYANRRLRDADFVDSEADAGEIGAGHQVTALYAVRLRDGEGRGARHPQLEPLRYGSTTSSTTSPAAGLERVASETNPEGLASDVPGFAARTARELAIVKVRYRHPDHAEMSQATAIVRQVATPQPFVEAGPDFRFAVAVAAFAERLQLQAVSSEVARRPGAGIGALGYARIADIAAGAATVAVGEQRRDRREFVELARRAGALTVSRAVVGFSDW